MKPILVGSKLKQLLRSIGVKPCGGCEKRAEKLDKIFAKKGGRAP